MTNKQKEIDKLERAILLNKRLYYRGEPTISDYTYDAIEDRLKQLSPEHTALSVVGSNDYDIPPGDDLTELELRKLVKGFGFQARGLDLEVDTQFRRIPGAEGDYLRKNVKHCPLFSDCFNGKLTEVKRKLNDGYDLHFRGPHGDTLLTSAAMGGRLKVCKLLVEAGIDIDAVGYERTAIQWAEKRGHDSIVKYLRSKGAKE